MGRGNRGYNVKKSPQQQHQAPLNWRRDSYEAQKKMKRSPANTLSMDDIQLELLRLAKPGKLTTALSLLMLNSVIIQANAQTLSKNRHPSTPSIEPLSYKEASVTTEQQMWLKMKVDPAIPKSQHASLNCHKIPQVFFNSQLPKAPINRVLRNPDSVILCSNDESISNHTRNKLLNQTPDSDNSNTVRLSYPFAPADANHEFIHADIFLRHRNGACRSKDRDALLPFYPVNEQNITNYINALDRGDARLREFKNLLKKQNARIDLTQEELELLAVYKDAIKDFSSTLVIKNPYEQYEELLSSGWKPGVRGIIFQYHGVRIEILGAERTKNKTLITARIMDVTAMVCNIPDIVQNTLKSFAQYNIRSKQGFLLAERDAHTFKDFPMEAMKVFYPEAYEIREKDRLLCATNEESDEEQNHFLSLRP